jgi:hypothetical protein
MSRFSEFRNLANISSFDYAFDNHSTRFDEIEDKL